MYKALESTGSAMCFISVEIEIQYSVMVHKIALKPCKNRPLKPLLYIVKLINNLTFDLVWKEYFVSMRGWLSGATAETNDALMRQLLLAIVSTAWIKISSTFSFPPKLPTLTRLFAHVCTQYSVWSATLIWITERVFSEFVFYSLWHKSKIGNWVRIKFSQFFLRKWSLKRFFSQFD